MSERSTGHPVVDSIVGVIRELNVTGLPIVLWTVVVCAALLKGEYAALALLWPDLFTNWVALRCLWGAARAVFAVARWFVARRAPVPVIAEPRAVAVVERAANR
jgi:hypothetical protein